MIDEFGAASDDAWRVSSDVPIRTVFDSYRDEIARANAIIASTHLAAPPAWWPRGLFGGWRLDFLQDVLLHVITETACHAGHLDAYVNSSTAGPGSP